MLDLMGQYTIPLALALVPLYGMYKRVDVFSSFIAGAREAFVLCLRILPYIVGIFVAIGVFRESGALDLFAAVFRPVLDVFGIPGEVLPLAIIRPLSGNGAFAVMSELLAKWGPDSFIGRLASTMQGSTDTTLYILSLYFGSVGVVRSRHALMAGLTADAAGIIAAAIAVKITFGS